MKKVKNALLIALLFGSASVSGQSKASKYIEDYKSVAVQLMQEYHVPASIILGVSLHESGSGTSKIARYLNNHFGIKGKNKSTKIRSSYKGYATVEDSYSDFVRIIKKRKQLAGLMPPFDYKVWVKTIQKSGYAKDPNWGKRVLNTIKKYKLYELDITDSSSLKETK